MCALAATVGSNEGPDIRQKFSAWTWGLGVLVRPGLLGYIASGTTLITTVCSQRRKAQLAGYGCRDLFSRRVHSNLWYQACRSVEGEIPVDVLSAGKFESHPHVGGDVAMLSSSYPRDSGISDTATVTGTRLVIGEKSR